MGLIWIDEAKHAICFSWVETIKRPTVLAIPLRNVSRIPSSLQVVGPSSADAFQAGVQSLCGKYIYGVPGKAKQVLRFLVAAAGADQGSWQLFLLDWWLGFNKNGLGKSENYSQTVQNYSQTLQNYSSKNQSIHKRFTTIAKRPKTIHKRHRHIYEGQDYSQETQNFS